MTDWPHAPPHRLLEMGTYMVTGATYQKINYFSSPESLYMLCDLLIKLSIQYNWKLQAWVVFANHYHFIANSPSDPTTLSAFISNLHVSAAKYINEKDAASNRMVWWQYWDSHITYSNSYFARLNYIHQNPVKHGLVENAIDYPWSSIGWFQKTASSSFCKTVSRFKTDKLGVVDDF